jgi:Zn-dependent protease with chaperone function
MDFQSRQEEARQNTFRLIVLFALGVVAIIVVVSALLIGLFFYESGEVQPLAAFAIAAPLTTLGIVGTSLVKSSQIRSGGGSYVAASLGGRKVDFNTLDLAEKQLANVVEEIAIASGMPVPAVFVLDEEAGINAFAAGWTPENAAIGVTRGALVHLNRRELQGVIAHEFSHIRNGDTRVKTRIIGWVFGIAVITVLGRILLHNLWWAPRRRSKGDNSALVLLAAAVGLIVIGSVGTLFARMIQAAVSRQREYLADASAVQYTRDPSGIGEALMKIGGFGSDNKIRAAHATEASHLFFSSAFRATFATHPPLKERIVRLLPDWDGHFVRPETASSEVPSASEAVSAGGTRAAGDRWGGMFPGPVMLPGSLGLGLSGAAEAGRDGLAETVSGDPSGGLPSPTPTPGVRQRFETPSFGGPTDAHIEHARGLLARIPEPVQNYLHTRQGAVAAVVALLVSSDPEKRQEELEFAGRAIAMDPAYLDAASKVISNLDRSLQLPAIDIALHSIQETPYEYRQSLSQVIRAVEGSHRDQDLFRWMLRRVVLRHIEDQHDDGSVSHNVSIGQLQPEAGVLFAVLSWYNSAGTAHAQEAFDAALTAMGATSYRIPPLEELSFDRIDAALEQLSRLDSMGRAAFVSGATAVVLYDGMTTPEEAELLRVVADAVRLPMPPLLPV